MLVPLALAAFMLLGPSVHKSDAGSPDASDQASLAERLSEPAPSRSVQIASALPALSVARSGLDAPPPGPGAEPADGRMTQDAEGALEASAASPPAAPAAVVKPPRADVLASSDMASAHNWSPFKSATTVRGVTDSEIRFGLSAPLTGPS